MKSIWGNAFVTKHRLYSGDITNHFNLLSLTRLNDDEVESFENPEGEDDDETEEITIIGGGGIYYLAKVGMSNSGKEYEYVVSIPAEVVANSTDLDAVAKEIIGRELSA